MLREMLHMTVMKVIYCLNVLLKEEIHQEWGESAGEVDVKVF
jgi:hypothetical protein